MQNSTLGFALITALIVPFGCDSGAQRGKYVQSGGGGGVLENDGGWIETFRGTASDNLEAPNQLLAAFLFVGNVRPGGSGSIGTYVSSFDVKASTDHFAITWDRQSDVVSILDAQYDRSRGNVFVLRMKDGALSSQQIATTLISDVKNDILAAVKQALPDDAEIQALAVRSPD